MDSPHGPLLTTLSFSGSRGWDYRLPRWGDGDKAFPNAKPGPITGSPPRIALKYQFNKRQADTALRLLVLKTAYFAAFVWLGYAYVLRADTAWIGRLLLGLRKRLPYACCLDAPAGGFRLELPEKQALVSRPSFVALGDGFLEDMPVLIALVQLQRMQFTALLPAKDRSSTLADLRERVRRNTYLDVRLSKQLEAVIG